MAIHVAILQRPYLDAVLAGRKTVESRLTKTAQPPYGQVQSGESIYLKASGGPFMAVATAGRIACFDGLTPAAVERLRRRYNRRVCGENSYWRGKRDARYATFIELRDVRPITEGPEFPRSPYRAWFVLSDSADASLIGPGRTKAEATAFEVTLTDGGIRNGYVSIASSKEGLPSGAIALLLPDGRTVRTDVYRGHRIRWRGWRPYFTARDMQAGDLVRFVPVRRGRYRVELIRHSR